MTQLHAEPGFRHTFTRQIGWYLAVGTIGLVADMLGYLFFAKVLGLPIMASRLAAFLPATLVTWAINRRFTFARTDGSRGPRTQDSRAPLMQYLRYLAVQGGGIVVSFVVFQSVLASHAGHDVIALAAGSAAALVFNFAGARLLVFTGRAGDASPLVVAGFGALSVVFGQDSNWDLANYHLYNAFAFLEGRLHTDFAAAGLQSYFNPLLDVPYYLMATTMPAAAVAFVMGAMHGLAAVCVAAIVRVIRPQATSREVWLLALAGCFSAGYLAQIGNGMGDATTALLVLWALLLVLRLIAYGAPKQTRTLMFAGFLVGMATGLKLTNASFAIGLAAALAFGGFALRDKLRAVLLFGVGGVIGLAIFGGWWWWRMWAEFGNPLFPQFNSIFASPFATGMSLGDPRWGPKDVLEALVYPFITVLNPKRLGEVALVDLLWPIAYAVIVVWLMRAVRNRNTADAKAPVDSGLMAFVVASYIAWLAVFAIGRYVVAVEVLLPLLVWHFGQRIFTSGKAVNWLKAVIVVAVAVSIAPMKTWGHASFADRSYTVPQLPIADASRDTVIFIAQPVAWMAPFLPHELAFVSLFNFPESTAYLARVRGIVEKRGGKAWVVLPVASDTAVNTTGRINDLLREYAAPSQGAACAAVDRVRQLSTRYRNFTRADGPICQFDQAAAERRDLPAENRAIAARWAGDLRARGMTMDPASCRLLEAAIGDQPQPFQFCAAAYQ